MNIVYLGLSFQSANKGCEALSYAFTYELNKVAKECGVSIHIYSISFSRPEFDVIPDTDIPIEHIILRIKKMDFWKRCKRCMKEADIVFDFTAGDSFTDMYGMKRYIIGNTLKNLAIRKSKCFVMGPQTYGPFKHTISRMWAKHIIKKSTYVYARDELSAEVIHKMVHKDIHVVTDIAFALPYTKRYRENSNKCEIGINPSGLLYNSNNSAFSLSIDYDRYIECIIEQLTSDPNNIVYLISHVWSDSKEKYENDMAACYTIHEKFPATIVAEGFSTPMDAKAFISGLDVFIGARMHATIAAFSTGCATIPVSYSYKFEGLYKSIGYPYIIEARKISTDEAVEKTLNWVNERVTLSNNAVESMKQVRSKLDVFLMELKDILSENCIDNK